MFIAAICSALYLGGTRAGVDLMLALLEIVEAADGGPADSCTAGLAGPFRAVGPVGSLNNV